MTNINTCGNVQFWKDRPTLVTGATGLLGGSLLRDLVGMGANVIAIVRDGAPQSFAAQEKLLDRVATAYGSIEDFAFLRRVIAEYSVDAVFHLAAQPLVGVAKVGPLSTLETNVRGTWNVLEASRLCNVRNVVVASSDKAYGDPNQLPYTEEHPMQGKYPYDVSKSCADLIARMYAASFNLPVVIARCANLYGGGDLNFSRVIPGVIQATLNAERFVIRSDGKFVRDFLYVKDASLAYLRLAECLANDRSLGGEAFNFGLGIRLTVIELVKKVLALMDRSDLEPIVRNEASAEIREQYLSSDKATAKLGWFPRFSLEAGLKETVEWYASRAGAAFEEQPIRTLELERILKVRQS